MLNDSLKTVYIQYRDIFTSVQHATFEYDQSSVTSLHNLMDKPIFSESY